MFVTWQYPGWSSLEELLVVRKFLMPFFLTPSSYLTSLSCSFSGTLWGLLVKVHCIDCCFFSLKYSLVFKGIFIFWLFPLPLQQQLWWGATSRLSLRKIEPLNAYFFSFLIPMRTDKDCFTWEEQGSDCHFHTMFVLGLWTKVKEPVTFSHTKFSGLIHAGISLLVEINFLYQFPKSVGKDC